MNKSCCKVSYLQEKFLNPLLGFLKQGISPEKLAWSVTLGAVIGLIPVIGVSTILCAALALAFRLNMVVIQAVNYFVYPLQLIFLVPFIRIGEFVFRHPDVALTLRERLELVRADWWDAMQKLWLSNIMGIAVWMVLMVPVTIILFYSLVFVFRKFEAKEKQVRVSQDR